MRRVEPLSYFLPNVEVWWSIIVFGNHSLILGRFISQSVQQTTQNSELSRVIGVDNYKPPKLCISHRKMYVWVLTLLRKIGWRMLCGFTCDVVMPHNGYVACKSNLCGCGWSSKMVLIRCSCGKGSVFGESSGYAFSVTSCMEHVISFEEAGEIKMLLLNRQLLQGPLHLLWAERK